MTAHRRISRVTKAATKIGYHFASFRGKTYRSDRDLHKRPHQFVLMIARVMSPMSRIRAGIGKRVLAIITATA